VFGSVFTDMTFLAGDEYLYFIPISAAKRTVKCIIFCHAIGFRGYKLVQIYKRFFEPNSDTEN